MISHATVPNTAISIPANGRINHAPASAKPTAITRENNASEPKTNNNKRKSNELAWRLKYVKPALSCSKFDSKWICLVTGAGHPLQTRGLYHIRKGGRNRNAP